VEDMGATYDAETNFRWYSIQHTSREYVNRRKFPNREHHDFDVFRFAGRRNCLSYLSL
jgi:hypothetical protein